MPAIVRPPSACTVQSDGMERRTVVADRRERIEMQRIYEQPGHHSYRVLVDRLWPRGVRKTDAALDEWAKDVAPSDELRRWYGHDPAKFDEFAKRYSGELRRARARAAVRHLLEVARRHRVMLLTATKDIDRSGAVVLREHRRKQVSEMTAPDEYRVGAAAHDLITAHWESLAPWIL